MMDGVCTSGITSFGSSNQGTLKTYRYHYVFSLNPPTHLSGPSMNRAQEMLGFLFLLQILSDHTIRIKNISIRILSVSIQKFIHRRILQPLITCVYKTIKIRAIPFVLKSNSDVWIYVFSNYRLYPCRFARSGSSRSRYHSKQS